jgi:hypothetical protein
MTTRTLTFTPDDGKRFELLLTGFLLGGNQANQSESGARSRSRDDRKREAKIVRALKAISDAPVTASTNGQPPDEARRTLRATGGAVVLEQDQLDVVIKYVEACPFLTHVSDDVDDLLDWLYAAPRGEHR